MQRNKHSIYYDHIGYTLIEWEVPADIPLDPKLGLENYEAMEWCIEHGVFELFHISGYGEDGEPLDENGEPFDERCVEAYLLTDKGAYAEYVIPFYEFRIAEAGGSPYCHKLEELEQGKPRVVEVYP